MAFAAFENLLKESMGLDAASIGLKAIERAVLQRAAACDVADPRAYWQRVSASGAELQELIEAVVVPETWFFRDGEAFSKLARMAHEEWLPAHAGGVLRVLSLPSSTGEEPYSIAMAILDSGVPAERFCVDAVDISARALAYARRGTFGKNSFRGKELGFRARHFETTSTGCRLSERVRRQVHFRRGNLFVTDWSPGPASYDAIFCRNLLIYFDRATQERAIDLLERQLTPGGLLFVAPSEAGVLLSHGCVQIKAPLAFAFSQSAGAGHKPPTPVRGSRKLRIAWQPTPPSAVARISSAAPGPRPVDQPSALATSDPLAEAAAALDEARELANQGSLDEAIGRCERHLQRYGPSAEAFHLLGLIRDAGGDQAEAATCYRKALYFDPHDGEVLIHLALLLEKLGKTAEAQLLRKRANRLAERTGAAR